MADDIYDEEASQTEAGDGMDDSKSENMDSSEETAMLPKSFFPGKKLEPGKVCKIKVEEVYEDEVMVSYVQHEGNDEDSERSEMKPGMMEEEDDVYA